MGGKFRPEWRVFVSGMGRCAMVSLLLLWSRINVRRCFVQRMIFSLIAVFGGLFSDELYINIYIWIRSLPCNRHRKTYLNRIIAGRLCLDLQRLNSMCILRQKRQLRTVLALKVPVNAVPASWFTFIA